MQTEKSVEQEEFSFCGLSCTACKSRFDTIRQKIAELDEAFDVVNMGEVAKAIPFMHGSYKGYRKMVAFSKNECPGCHQGGGNPFCGIRKCVRKKGYATCAECVKDMCGKFGMLLRVHRDGELQKNRELLKARKQS